jgi:drug/metabolite transporter (DMT)-like permease
VWRIWLAALFWGLNFPAVKILIGGISPWTLRAIGLTLGGVLLATVTIASGQSLAIPKRHWRDLAIAGLLALAGFNMCAVFAQLLMPASRAAILIYTMPLWSVLLSWLILGEQIDRLRGQSLAVGGLGLALLSIPFWLQLQSGEPPYGLVFVLGAAISWAFGTVYLKRSRIEATPLAITTWQVLAGAAVTTIGMLLFETPRIELTPTITATLAYHVIFPQAVAYALWFGLMARVSASTAAIGTLLVPIFGVIGSVILLSEQPTALDLVGFGLILLAVLIDQGYRAMRTRKGLM